MDINLADRLFNFSIDVINFLTGIKNIPELTVVKYQLTKSSTSSGANYEEAQAASSRPDFKHRISISLREMREANYWIRILNSINAGDNYKCKYLMNESLELKKILGSICSKIK